MASSSSARKAMALGLAGKDGREDASNRCQARLAAKETLEFFRLGFGDTQVLSGFRTVLLIKSCLGSREVRLHELLGGGYVSAQTITLCGLLLAQVV